MTDYARRRPTWRPSLYVIGWCIAVVIGGVLAFRAMMESAWPF